MDTTLDAAGVAPRGGWTRWASPVLVVAVTVWAYRAMLGQGFLSDDFGLLLGNRDLGIDGTLRFLLFADYGEREWAYWRPGWVFLVWLVHATFGPDPLAFKCMALALHLGCVLTVYAVAVATTRSRALGAAAALLFALHGAHAEAVVWVAAALNVVPAATLLTAASWCAFRHAATGVSSTLLAAWLLAAASLLWKEAAYGFPLVLLGAWWSARQRGPWRRRDAAHALAVAAFAALVACHYLFRNKSSGFAGSVGDVLQVFAASVTAFVRPLVAVPGHGIAVASCVGLLAALAIAVARGPTRFWVVATLAGTLPYVLLNGGSRFSYFFHAPLCLALACALARLLRVQAAPWRAAVAAALLLVPLLLAPVSLRAEIDRFGSEAAKVDRILTAFVRDGHATSGRVLVDRVPQCLMNGFEPALALRYERSVRIVSLEAVRRPPFLIHIDVSGEPFPRAGTVLRFDDAAERYVAMPGAAMLDGLAPVPLFAICHRFRVVAGEAEARQALAAGGATPDVEPLLYEAPAVAIDPAASGSVGQVRTDMRNLGVTVSCSGPSLLVVAFPLPADFRTPPGAIWIDGEPVPVLIANILFHAVVIPAGTHDVRLLPTFGG